MRFCLPMIAPALAALIGSAAGGCGVAQVENGGPAAGGEVEKNEAAPPSRVAEKKQLAEPIASSAEKPGQPSAAPESATRMVEGDIVYHVSDDACETDADCVPGECCHPKTCVAATNAPDCTDMMCTMDCRGGTMDCGWGNCICREGKCAARIKPPPEPKIKGDPPPPPPPQ